MTSRIGLTGRVLKLLLQSRPMPKPFADDEFKNCKLESDWPAVLAENSKILRSETSKNIIEQDVIRDRLFNMLRHPRAVILLVSVESRRYGNYS